MYVYEVTQKQRRLPVVNAYPFWAAEQPLKGVLFEDPNSCLFGLAK